MLSFDVLSRTLSRAAIALMLGACAVDPTAENEGEEAVETTEDAVMVDTSSRASRAQYDANVAFANAYTATCAVTSTRPRVLITGFGRFLENATNASGKIVSRIVPAARYPLTTRPDAGEIDPPASQVSVAQRSVVLPEIGTVDVCAMIVPVYWDLAAILVAKEIQAFRPSAVFMNGIAYPTQPMWIELGAVNRATVLRDGSDVLVPVVTAGATTAPIVSSAAASDSAMGNFLSWTRVRDAVEDAISAGADVQVGGVPLSGILQGAEFAGFPRSSNTYLCNNITYVTNYLLSYPNRPITLLQASSPRAGVPNGVRVSITADLRQTSRTFFHWPSSLTGAHVHAAARVLKAAMGAQLAAVRDARSNPALAPTRGSNTLLAVSDD